MINAEQLIAIKERAAKATPGPWRTPMRTIYSNDGYVANTSRMVDAEFIAAAREDIPALVAEIEQLQISDASKEASSIRYYNDYKTEKIKCSATLHELIRAEEENARLRKALAKITAHRVNNFLTQSRMVESMFETAKEALK